MDVIRRVISNLDGTQRIFVDFSAGIVFPQVPVNAVRSAEMESPSRRNSATMGTKTTEMDVIRGVTSKQVGTVLLRINPSRRFVFRCVEMDYALDLNNAMMGIGMLEMDVVLIVRSSEDGRVKRTLLIPLCKCANRYVGK